MSECMSKEGYVQRIKECQIALRNIADSKVLGDGTKETWSCGITASHLLTDLLDRVSRAQPDNPPLTLEQLFERVGKEPIYAISGDKGYWCVLDTTLQFGGGTAIVAIYGRNMTLGGSDYGKTWLAYAHRKDGDR